MNQIDFLPESFHRNRERRRRRPVLFLTIVATGAMLFGMWQLFGGPDPVLARQSQELDASLEYIAQQQSQAKLLTAERDRLSRDLKIARETNQPIAVAQVLAHLAELAPEPIRLTDFKLVAQRPEPEPLPRAGDTRQTAMRRAQATHAGASAFQIVLTGLAPSDDEVVAFSRALDQSALFTDVTLRNSKLIQTRTHVAREFQLELTINLDRRFIRPGQRGGAADAD